MFNEPPWMPRTEEEYRQQLAEDAGPQPDEMVRLQQEIDFLNGETERLSDALDTAESVAQMAAHDRDEALENFARVEQEYAQLEAAASAPRASPRRRLPRSRGSGERSATSPAGISPRADT